MDCKARDYALIVATLDQVSLLEKEARFAAWYPEQKEGKGSESTEVITDARLQRKIAAREEVERALRQAKKENQACRHEIGTLQREIEELKNRLAEKKQAAEHVESPEEIVDTDTESVQYPYHTKLRVVLYGRYYTVCDACKSSGVPYIHLNFASARRCAGVMVKEIEKIRDSAKS
ncbi:MAG: hypothetical protein LUE92_11605 [Clostridiales bacterium]|nr:hypothetical protein [Clostridiales bacterium]